MFHKFVLKKFTASPNMLIILIPPFPIYFYTNVDYNKNNKVCLLIFSQSLFLL